MVGGAVDNLFQIGTTPATTVGTTPNAQETATNPVHDGGDFLDKISDFIPGTAGEKIEDFTKDKLGGLFGGDKKV